MWLLGATFHQILGHAAHHAAAHTTAKRAFHDYPTEQSGSAETAARASSPAPLDPTPSRSCRLCRNSRHLHFHEHRAIGPLRLELSAFRNGLTIARVGCLAAYIGPNAAGVYRIQRGDAAA